MKKSGFALTLLTLTWILNSCIGQSNTENGIRKENTFKEHREKFSTTLIPNSYTSDGLTPAPPDSIFKVVQYKSDVGLLDAYLRTNLDTTESYPIVIWAHGGFGGIGSWFWEYDSYIECFLNADVVVLCPSWRGENQNPGDFELFYGEVNDLSHAIDYAKSLTYVDSNRIYLAGHSTGGTLALLTSLINKDIRATFSFGGAPDIQAVVSDGQGYGNTPFNYHDKKESEIRSSINYVDDIQNPIFYFEGEDSFYPPFALLMQEMSKKSNALFKAYIIPGGTHFNIVRPINELIIEKILADDSTELNIGFSMKDIESKMKR